MANDSPIGVGFFLCFHVLVLLLCVALLGAGVHLLT